MFFKLLMFYAFCLLINVTVNAQDLIYYANGKVVERKVTEITDQEVKATVINNPEVTFSARRSGVLFVFNRMGNFLVMSALEKPNNKTSLLIYNFFNASRDPSVTPDLIITLQNNIICCNSTAVDGTEIKYSVNGRQSKIPMSDVALVIFKNGTHKLFTDAAKANHVLSSLQEKYDDMVCSTPKHNLNGSTLENPGVEKGDKELSLVSYKDYSERALQKTKNLSDYIRIICDKSTDLDNINKAMSGALELFANEDVWIEVSSKNSGQVRRVKIRNYLDQLKLLNYQKIEIDWMNIQYVSKLHKAEDNNYYGLIRFEQQFSGIRAGKVVYKDMTKKNVEVMLKTMPVRTDGKTSLTFDVLLSNIGIVETK